MLYEEEVMKGLRERHPLDVAVLRKALSWAEAEAARPDQSQCEWYQRSWVIDADVVGRECGTCYCIAGYIACEIAGKPNSDLGVEFTAAEALNLPYYVVRPLFTGDNSIEEVRNVAEYLVRNFGEPGETL